MNINEECLLRFLNNPDRLTKSIKEFEKITISANFKINEPNNDGQQIASILTA
ncbi:MAG: hypothetical protein PHV68_09170 [Candidatus Gastranaerophilales bacterium]|nr:hypothetical protein [Candidatus Gastranaerophilales bacterium]